MGACFLCTTAVVLVDYAGVCGDFFFMSLVLGGNCVLFSGLHISNLDVCEKECFGLPISFIS